jgi:signal transduction histidine kinase
MKIRLRPMGLPSLGGPPLGWQLIAMLVCTLVAAQLVTLALTVLLPPRPPRQWNIEDVAAALSGRAFPDHLEQARLAGPPDIAGSGWLISETARDTLARRLGMPAREVVLAFYTQLPVGGVAVPVGRRAPLAVAAPTTLSTLLVPPAQAQSVAVAPTGGFPGGAIPGGVIASVSLPGGTLPSSIVNSLPTAGLPGSFSALATTVTPGALPHSGDMPGHGMPQGGPPVPGTGHRPGGNPAHNGHVPGLRGMSGLPMGGLPRALPDSAMPSGGAATNFNMLTQLRKPLAPRDPVPRDAALASPLAVATPLPTPVLPLAPVPVLTAPHSAAVLLPQPLVAAPVARAPTPAPVAAAMIEKPQPIPFRTAPAGLLDRASPPFIEGDFIAAVRRPDGHWVAVAPRAEPFPNRWQRQVLAWFILSLVIVSPLAWFLARRIVLPLEGFARAAEMLGRDPSATIIPLSGPAEIGRAAHAFNQMHNRLRAFVDDRTAMVGAISHDLRTPLTRLRFRLEDVPDSQRPALLREVAEMESMINEVIVFIRDASTPGARQRVDLAALVADSVADARLVGGDVEVVGDGRAPVEVDPVGIRRLLGNLLENAVKYGSRARVRVTMREGEAVAEILDAGPGIAVEEMDRVFEPFYRSPEARRSGRPGSGLGLAVCRSIARAHGGDVRFVQHPEGFAAVLTVPVVYDARHTAGPRLAA